MSFSFSDLIWVAILLVAVQPVIHQRLLDSMRRRKIADIEKARGSS
jgi:hypothetical protein